MEQAFLGQLTQDPLGAGIAYSDWLEESGRLAEAEFVRHALDLRSENPKPRMVWCPPGTFVMGSPVGESGGDLDEYQVEVTLTRGFWMGKYQVTQAEWIRLACTNPSEFSKTGRRSEEVQGMETSRFPVESVSWDMCVGFCEILSQSERNFERLPRDWEYRLPTEAEWEYACRAGTTTAFAFGDQLDGTQANFCGAKKLRTPTPVGSYPANAWGLHDMHGNVWEWCLDKYRHKTPGGVDPLVDDFVAPENRILKGGGCGTLAEFCRSAQRHKSRYPSAGVGFRILAGKGINYRMISCSVC